MIFLMGLLASILLIILLVAKGLFERILIVIFVALVLYIKKKIDGKKNAKLLIIGLLVGYLLGIMALPLFVHRTKTSYIATNYIKSDSLAVILVHQDEPSNYSFSSFLKKEIDSTKKWQYPTIPFRLFKEKLIYEGITIDDLNYNISLNHKLKDYFNDEVTFYSAYINKEPYIDEIFHMAMKAGHGKIIICPILLTESQGYNEIQNAIQRVNPQQYMISVKATMPMWDSENIARSCVEWFNGYISKEKRSRVGILMTGSRFYEGMETNQHVKQEMLFRAKVKDILIEEGYQVRQISQSFLDKKRITSEINELMLKGVSNIYVFQGASLYDNPLAVYNTKRIIDDIDKPEGVSIYYITGWQLEEGVYKELQKRIQLLIMQKWN